MNLISKKIFSINSKIKKMFEKQQDFKKNSKILMWKFFGYFKYFIVRELNF